MWKDKMIQAGFWSTLFYSICYPFIHIWLMREVNEKMVSASSMTMCVAIIIFNSLWNKHSNKFYKFFPALMLLEFIAYTILHIFAILGMTKPTLYYIIDTLLFSLITRNMICGGNKLRSEAYKDEQREKFDNTLSIVNSMATLIGGTIALIFTLPMWLVFILCQIGLSIDNLFYYLAYKEKKNEKND